MENKKMTKKETINLLIDVLEGRKEVEDTQILVDFLVHERELLERKNSSNTKTKVQIENENIKVEIVNALVEFGKAVSVTELMGKVAYSNQKLSALLKQLVEVDKKVERIEDKRKVLFKAI